VRTPSLVMTTCPVARLAESACRYCHPPAAKKLSHNDPASTHLLPVLRYSAGAGAWRERPPSRATSSTLVRREKTSARPLTVRNHST
jgi:hypothetical protein